MKMNCGNLRKHIHLYQPGELSEPEKKFLKRHLSDCSSCMDIAKQMGTYEQLMIELRERKPVLPEPNKLIDNTLNAIMQDKNVNIMPFKGIFNMPLAKVAASIFIIFQVSLFCYQQFFYKNPVRQTQTLFYSDDKERFNIQEVLNKEIAGEYKTVILNFLSVAGPEIRNKAIIKGKTLSAEDVKNYSLKVRQFTSNINNIDKEQKEELILHFIKNELSYNL